MGVSTILILLPGLLAFGVSKALSRAKSQPINEIIIDLVVQTVLVFLAYYLISSIERFGVPTFGEVAVQSIKIKDGITDDALRAAVKVFEKALCISVIVAFCIGVISALVAELKIIPRIGRRFWLFQSDGHESAWKTTFEAGSLENWIQIDTKAGLRYIGLSHSVSWDRKDGGFGLSKVHLFDEENKEVIPVADFMYVSSEEIEGPILFVKGEPKEGK